MQSLKRRMIPFFSVILCTVLGSLLILGSPASARASNSLEANTAYKAYAKDDCNEPTAYIEFKFDNPKFEEIYPIQDGWELYFNTPSENVDETDETPSENVDGDGNETQGSHIGTWTNVGECEVQVEPLLKGDDGLPLPLLSGFKTEDEAKINKSGHFVVAKDYYAVEDPVEDVNQCKDPDDHLDEKKNICYKRLGSLTAIGGDNFPALGGAAIGQLIIKPNAIRAPHWHLQFAEAGYCYGGIGQVGVIVPPYTLPRPDGEGLIEKPTVQEMFIKEDEVFLFPEGSQHYLRNIGNEDFTCTLFFTEGPPLNGDQLLTITLQNIVGNTPLGVLGPVLVTNDDDPQSIMYTAERVSASPAQTYTSVDQGPDVIKVIETCRGSTADYTNPGCPARKEPQDTSLTSGKKANFPSMTSGKKANFPSIYSRLEP